LEDKQFTTQFMAVLVLLFAFTIVILVIANAFYDGDEKLADARVQKAVAERIAPVGQVYVGEVPAAAAEVEAVATTVAVAMSGDQVYQQVCASCHTSGIMNAPKMGDAAAWQARLAKGKETLYANAINGIGAMPAKGGRADMSDDAIRAAVDHLIK
jgi:cytochrome c5